MKFIIEAICTYKRANEEENMISKTDSSEKNPLEYELKLEPFEIETESTSGFTNEAFFGKAVETIRSKLLFLFPMTVGLKSSSSITACGCYDEMTHHLFENTPPLPITKEQLVAKNVKTDINRCCFYLVFSPDRGREIEVYVQMNLKQNDNDNKVSKMEN